VAKFIPEAAAVPAITLRHLLSHRSGLKDTLKALLAVTFRGEAAPTSAEALGRFRLVAARRPGERVEYRNVNYALLGEVVSRTSGLEYRDYVARHLLTPLGLRAAFSLTDEMRRNAATGYIRWWDPMRLALRVLLPDVARQLYAGRVGDLMELREFTLDTAAIGGLVGSVTEFTRFLQMQLSEGAGVLTPASTRLMQTMVAEGAAGIESRVGVGLGWKMGRVGGRTFLNHEGGGAGFTSELRLYPEAGIGVALAMNTMRMPHTMRAAHRLCEAVFEARRGLL
jgi:CubicO group peptidase (beta-lactamase class C family)